MTCRMSTDKLERVSFLDTFRFVAVTFALLAHVATQHGFDLYDTDSGLVSKALTRSATPSLLIVFGVMLEIVYGRRFADKPDMVASRMLYRARAGLSRRVPSSSPSRRNSSVNRK